MNSEVNKICKDVLKVKKMKITIVNTEVSMDFEIPDENLEKTFHKLK